MTIKTTTLDFISALPMQQDVAICSASYEERCLTIPAILSKTSVKRVFIFHNENLSQYISGNLTKLTKLFGKNAITCGCSTDNPLKTIACISSMWTKIIASRPKNILIDITTFTHEALLILLKTVIINFDENININIVYNGASEYSIGLSNENKWLSKGILDIRSILGYPGELLPSLKTHLIVLVGFEHERAIQLIETYQPSVVSLGYGTVGSTTNPQHFITNQFFHRLLIRSAAISNIVDSFEFSSSDPVETKVKLYNIIKSHPNYNHVIAPMNTKLSTIAAGLVAHSDASIQLCYAQPRIYNYAAYSKPSHNIYIVNLHDIIGK